MATIRRSFFMSCGASPVILRALPLIALKSFEALAPSFRSPGFFVASVTAQHLPGTYHILYEIVITITIGVASR